MIIKYFILSVSYFCTYGFSIGTVSETPSLDKSARQDDLFPDWVPFKNKHGDELGFKVVKNKVKKRLAPPINFLIRNLEPEGDYFGGLGDGGSDSEDYFEKKDWSDVHRLSDVGTDKVALHHTELSDIDGVVSILTKQSHHPLAQVINVHVDNNRDRPGAKTILDFEENQPVIETPERGSLSQDNDQKKREDSDKQTEENENTTKIVETITSPETVTVASRADEPVVEEEHKDELEDEKKKEALDSVDELKMRHAEEQRDISDRAKEEELYKELFEKYIASPEDTSKLKASRKQPNRQLPPPDYDEYEDHITSVNEKYKIKPILKETPEPVVYTTTYAPSTSEPSKPRTSKYVESGKLSVFRNPQLYMIYDDDDTTTVKPRKSLGRTSKYSSYKGSAAPTGLEEERISLVPVDSKEGEPTLFLPAKNKKKFKNNNTTTRPNKPNQEAYDIYPTRTFATDTPTTDTSATYTSATDTSATGPSATDTSGTGTSATDTSAADTQQTVDVTEPTAVEAVTNPDAEDSASDQHKQVEEKDYSSKQGGGKEHHSEYSEEHEEHGKKAYEGYHKDNKKKTGHHDKEDHLGKYDDHGGLKKEHHDESEHHGGHHHEEHGKKHAKYEESGKHSKGHSTKGSHDIHKKEEYEKKVEFFEEEGDEDEEGKHGGYSHEKEHKKGGHFKNGNLLAGHKHKSKGETGHFKKRHHAAAQKGHNLAAGYDSHGKRHKDHSEQDGNAGSKKWIYHHGSPAKTANLVVIDRRGDQYYHGPHYYG